MEELKDYSGPFRPDLKLTDFSKDLLARAWVETGNLYLMTDGMWGTIIGEKYGEQRAVELDTEMWHRLMPLDILRWKKLLNLGGDDVETVFKFLQVHPLLTIYEYQMELKNRGHGILTITRCPTLEYFERHKRTAIMEACCCDPKGLEYQMFQLIAHHFGPKITVTPMRLPPRKGKDEIACQWEFKIEE
ncbi:MAG: hypothetical protein ISS53_04020 [Dehalococcoidia bacterium]|nr:hypothetical protein [Dehalococcoidia bacterium]